MLAHVIIRAPVKYNMEAPIVVGMTDLMNTQFVDSNKNLTAIERDVGGGRTPSGMNPGNSRNSETVEEMYLRELSMMSRDLGLSLHDVGGVPPNQSNRKDEYGDNDDNGGNDDNDDDDDSSDHSTHRSGQSHKSTRSKHSDIDTTYNHKQSKQQRTSNYAPFGEPVEARASQSYKYQTPQMNGSGYQTPQMNGSCYQKQYNSGNQYMTTVRSVDNIPNTHTRTKNAITEEQEKRQHVDAIMNRMRKVTKTSFGLDHERGQDVRASMVEQIGQLIMTLDEEGVDTTSVSKITSDSSPDEIESVLTILKLKNDRNRYSSMAEEVMLGAAEIVETVLDGSRPIPFLGWKPDYTGYHNTVNVKLHRMRYETSRVVGSVIEKNNIGPTARIALELLPSLLMYPRHQQKQRQHENTARENTNKPHMANGRSAYAGMHGRNRTRDEEDMDNL
jgi:hypothetical protein